MLFQSALASVSKMFSTLANCWKQVVFFERLSTELISSMHMHNVDLYLFRTLLDYFLEYSFANIIRMIDRS